MYGSTPDLYSDDGIEGSDGGFEWFQTCVFIRKNAKFRGRTCEKRMREREKGCE